MGYYVRITKSTAVLPKENLQRAYEKMCALNITHDHLKHGGSWANGKQTGKWFSWVDENYPETCLDARAILDHLGFKTAYNDQGDLLILSYDNKRGQEDLFLEAITTEVLGEIYWKGEAGEAWITEFLGGLIVEEPRPLKRIGHSTDMPT